MRICIKAFESEKKNVQLDKSYDNDFYAFRFNQYGISMWKDKKIWRACKSFAEIYLELYVLWNVDTIAK